MKRIFLIFLECMMVQGMMAQNIDSLLLQVRENDQKSRHETTELIKRGNTLGFSQTIIDSLFFLEEETKRLDQVNIQIIDQILQSEWPKDLTPSSYRTIFLVIDHAELEKQKQHLPFIKSAAKSGKLKLSDLATLTDRIAVREKRPQTYGTQSHTTTTEEGKTILYIWPVEEPDGLNLRREALGLGTIEEYTETLLQSSGFPCFYDPKMTVEEMLKLIDE